jgi:hypothetical protein
MGRYEAAVGVEGEYEGVSRGRVLRNRTSTIASLFAADLKKLIGTYCELEAVFFVPRFVEPEHEIEFGPEMPSFFHDFQTTERQRVPELLRVVVVRELNVLPKLADFFVMVADGGLQHRKQGRQFDDEGSDFFPLIVCGTVNIGVDSDRCLTAQ